MRTRTVYLGVVLAGLALLGAGCAWFDEQSQDQTFKGLNPKQAAEGVQFMPGDTFEIRQTFLGIGSFLAELRGRDGVRQVTITRFAPMNVANLQWTIKTERQRQEEVKVDRFEQVLTAPGTQINNEPKIVTETVTVSGTLLNINLKESHSALLPAYWKEGPVQADNEKSAIWLSDDAYMELSRTKQTPLNLGVFDSEVNELAKNWIELNEAMDKLRSQANKDFARGDLTLLKADNEPIQVKLKINGQDVTVQAIRARNWFGEITVLDSRQNPMILKVVVNPLFAGAREFLGGGLESLDELFGYEVTDVVLKR